MTIRAVLWDIGGPIDLEIKHEQIIDREIRRVLAEHGCLVSDDDYQRANDEAVRSFAPNLYLALAWTLTRCDRHIGEHVHEALTASSKERYAERGGLELRPGIAQLLARIKDAGLAQGIAANQPAWMIDELDRIGIGQYFDQRAVSATLGYKKPDVRLFLAACEHLGVEPSETIMIGDRIDNDVCPAKTLGMKTVLLRTGRHINQQPRSANEVPDAEVRTMEELESALFSLAR
jgi:HAD superfamily hydrolase (TIGR01509 family)